MTTIFNWIKSNSKFLLSLALITLSTIVFYDKPAIAMWVGFAIAGYSAIANDSIQTLGTFLSSNKSKPWWVLWIYIGTIMLLTFYFGWYFGNGDIAHGRLDSIPQPENFRFLQLLAPVILLFITKLSMPVSTTFLLLSVFSSKNTIEGMLLKTFIGYIAAFLTSYIIWYLLSQYRNKNKIANEDKVHNKNDKYWLVIQWITTGFLWMAWLMQDIANIAVFLPRELPLSYFLIFSIYLFIMLGYLFYKRGGEIQTIVNEKTDITDVRSATMVDFIYTIILVIFKEINNLPMSTTWVFLGLLAGRELAFSLHSNDHDITYQKSLVSVMKDLSRAGMGLVISILLAVIINL